MKPKKWLSLLLGLLMLAIPLASCSSGKTPDTPSTDGEKTEAPTDNAETVDPNTVPDLPGELDFKGKTIRILTRRSETRWQEWGSNDLLDEKKASVIDQKVYYRNDAIMKRLNVNFDFTHAEVGDGADFNQLVTNAATMGNSYDIVSNKAYESVQSNLLDCVVNLYDVPNLNLAKSYWNRNFISAGTVNDNLYTVVGDMNLSVYMCMFCMYFNINQCEAQGEDWSAENLFDTVLNGDWTWELLKTYVEKANVSPDGNPSLYALYSHWYSQAFDGMIQAFDMQLVTTDPDNNKHSLVAGTGWTKMQNAAKMIHGLYNNSAKSAKLDTTGTATGEYNLFDEGETLFMVECVNDAQKRRDAELADEYGLLPLPKYDTNQKSYYTGVQDSHNVISVMKGDKNFEAIGAVLELLSANSYEEIRPYYVNTLVKSQYLDNEKSGKVLDLVLDGAKWDFASIYASYLRDDQGGKAPHDRLWRAGCYNGEADLAKRYDQYKDYWNRRLEEFDKDPHFAAKSAS